MRRPIIAGNWKLHNNLAESEALASGLAKELADVTDIEIVIAPVFTALHKVATCIEGSPISLAAQNCHPETKGAFTGEVSPQLLQDIGCASVILGHSERRQLFGEDNQFINQKVKAVLASGLKAILCIGETLEERENGAMFDVLRAQVTEGLSGVETTQLDRVVIAYEPVWAIGTGKTASNDQAQEAHSFIRGLIMGMFSLEESEKMRILYGGSVKPDNVDGLMAEADVDGALVGGASLKVADFARIARFERGN